MSYARKGSSDGVVGKKSEKREGCSDGVCHEGKRRRTDDWLLEEEVAKLRAPVEEKFIGSFI